MEKWSIRKKGGGINNNNNRSIEVGYICILSRYRTRYGKLEGRQDAELPSCLGCGLLRLVVSTSPARWLLSREHVRAPQEPAYSSDSLTENRQFRSLLRPSRCNCEFIVTEHVWCYLRYFIFLDVHLLQKIVFCYDRYHAAQAEISFPCASWNICHIDNTTFRLWRHLNFIPCTDFAYHDPFFRKSIKYSSLDRSVASVRRSQVFLRRSLVPSSMMFDHEVRINKNDFSALKHSHQLFVPPAFTFNEFVMFPTVYLCFI
jgi:hypothetical protein